MLKPENCYLLKFRQNKSMRFSAIKPTILLTLAMKKTHLHINKLSNIQWRRVIRAWGLKSPNKNMIKSSRGITRGKQGKRFPKKNRKISKNKPGLSQK